MLAQAVARKSKLHLLSISSGDVFQKAWGGDEKVIRAAFKLARRLHPCIMFIDEADGMLGNRKEDDKKHHNTFVLLATNRPWDVDPAVLRRAPVRVLIDKPTIDQRKEILKILLREETLSNDLTIDFIATRTRSFSGSDLKSLCVSAALRCVQQQMPDDNGHYPQERVLYKGHFEFAF
ncbi:Outer mitochondrial transmembrane helix translocase [Cladobotryum mycophilum]|uniref:Outer mitochondrial transmembrane helix translocase n=1 Tax=Cladobotryum mycophilum TaxID=491253 RepID=A0ABR0T439_9HYPO